MNISVSAFAPENLVSRDGFGSPVPRQPAHLYTRAESGAYLRDSSRVPRRRPFIYLKPPYAIGSVLSLSGDVIACQWRSLPRVRRHMANKPQGSSKRVLPLQVPMGQFICISFPHPLWACESTVSCYSYSINVKDGALGSMIRERLRQPEATFPLITVKRLCEYLLQVTGFGEVK